ncbi:cellulose biosynthesis protein BcsG, partial [Klebsiella pneumoniae]
PAPASGAPFDVIILNICSLAWSDLDEVGLRQNNLLDRMDVVFDDFNSATAYSGPAAIRLLRASCGQTSHTALFDPVPAECQLFSNLQRLGFQSELAMNHDGHFDDFIGELSKYGGLQAKPMDINPLPRALVAFDKSPLRRDGDVLNSWFKQRQAESTQQVALFY